MRRKLNYFFTDENTSAAHTIRDLQHRATWIALALILQALNEIDHNYYLPILKQFTSLPPLFLLLGSFYALWMAIRPAQATTRRPGSFRGRYLGEDLSRRDVGDRKGSPLRSPPSSSRQESGAGTVGAGLAPTRRPYDNQIPSLERGPESAQGTIPTAPNTVNSTAPCVEDDDRKGQYRTNKANTHFVGTGLAPVPTDSSAISPHSPEIRSQPLRSPSLWQRVVLFLALILTIPGVIQIGYTTFICFTPPVFTNDGTSLDTNAAILLLAGRNPYTDSNILQIARRFHIQPNWTTPLRQGTFANHLDYPTMNELQTALDTALKTGDASAFESKVSYPVLSFLTLVPFIALHDYNVQPFYLLCYFLLVFLAWKWARSELRPWVILLAIADVPMLASTMGGNLDIFYTLLIALAWWLRDRRWITTLFFGLALASKQIAWYFVPFYFIMNWRLYGFKEAVYRLVGAGMLGMLINLPFIVWNPQAWLAGILAPVVDPMFPMGVGIVNLSVTHLIPYLPEKFYTVLQITVFLVSIAWYWHMSRVRPESAIFFAVLPLFFNWRSLPSYFYCVAYPMFVLMVARTRPQALPPTSSDVFYPNIEKLYLFRDANDVKSFLEENPFLISLLQEAYIHIREYFPHSDVVLEVVTDPEIMGEKDLVAFIVVEQTAEEASQALDRLDEEWWMEALDRAQDKLHITLEFR